MLARSAGLAEDAIIDSVQSAVLMASASLIDLGISS